MKILRRIQCLVVGHDWREAGGIGVNVDPHHKYNGREYWFKDGEYCNVCHKNVWDESGWKLGGYVRDYGWRGIKDKDYAADKELLTSGILRMYER